MEKEFIPYKESLALKELGFNEPCFGYYDIDSQELVNDKWMQHPNESTWTINAPTFSQAFRWFREKHFILYDIVFYREDKRTKKGYWYNIFQWNFDMTKRNIINVNLYFTTYEEAELECLRKLIEIVKQKND